MKVIHKCGIFGLNCILGVENTIRIDAGTNPYAQSRFCLGRIANNKRNKLIEQVRTSIGRGIELSGGHQHSRGIFTLMSLQFTIILTVNNCQMAKVIVY